LAHNLKQKQGSPTLYPVDQVESARFADRDRRTSADLLAQLVPNAQRSHGDREQGSMGRVTPAHVPISLKGRGTSLCSLTVEGKHSIIGSQPSTFSRQKMKYLLAFSNDMLMKSAMAYDHGYRALGSEPGL
jgi:hypothetical protein